MDRRIQKTKDAIVGAFVQLMSEKSFEKITINEIAERANVNRGTVYLHYSDIYDLLDKCIEEYLERLFQSCLPTEGGATLTVKASLLRTFEYLEQNAFFYITMLTNKGILTFRNRLLSMIIQTLQSENDNAVFHKDIKKDLLEQFVASAAVGVIEWWLINSRPYSAQVMVEQFWVLLERLQDRNDNP